MKRRFNVPVRSLVSLADTIQNVEGHIRARAFELFLERGSQPGWELDDWLSAQAEIVHQPETSVTETDRQIVVNFALPESSAKGVEVLVTNDRILLISRSL